MLNKTIECAHLLLTMLFRKLKKVTFSKEKKEILRAGKYKILCKLMMVTRNQGRFSFMASRKKSNHKK